MPEIGTSGSMSGDGKRAIGKASSTAPILDSTRPGRMRYSFRKASNLTIRVSGGRELAALG
jgi:hypothetical protein